MLDIVIINFALQTINFKMLADAMLCVNFIISKSQINSTQFRRGFDQWGSPPAKTQNEQEEKMLREPPETRN